MARKKFRLKEFLTKDSEEKKYATNRSHVPFRLNVLFGVIFILFVALIVKLGNLQIVDGDNMEKRIRASSVRTVTESTPRGMIYDSKGRALVENNSEAAITFTRGLDMKAEDLLKIAEKVNKLIDIDPDKKLTTRDLKDYWLADKDNLAKARKRLTKKEKKIDDSKIYATLVKKVKKSEIDFSKKQLKIATIFTRLNGTQELTTNFIKNENVSNEEIARVAEHSQNLQGVSTGMDWTRSTATNNDSLQSVIGKVSTREQGLPAEQVDEYLKKGYSRNDRVGTSYLEKEYENVLQGKKAENEVTINRQGEIVKQTSVDKGKKGDNLKLTVDAAFQRKVDSIVKSNYQSLLDNGNGKYSPGVYTVALNPKTGEILALSGYYHDIKSDELQEDTIGVYTKAFVPGSVVKAGTLTAGWKSGAINGNQVLYDQPIRLQGSSPKASIFNKDGSGNQSLSAQKALEYSSNSYMMQIALKMMGINYSGGTISIPGVASQKKVYQQLRSAMGQYGMGVKTGIDLPNEVTGIHTAVNKLSDANNDAGKILDLAFGQFDTYTPMQLAQYVSTVANSGTRVEPHIVKGIYGTDNDGDLGKEKKKIKTKTLNKVDISSANMKIIQNGFYDVVHGNGAWTTGTDLASAKMKLAAKTGTAEGVVYDNGKEIDVDSLNMVSYGPYKDPEIAVAVMVPQVTQGNSHLKINQTISKQIMDAYYDMYKK